MNEDLDDLDVKFSYSINSSNFIESLSSLLLSYSSIAYIFFCKYHNMKYSTMVHNTTYNT